MANSYEHRRLKVFISHQWTDKQTADRLARDLESFADVWMDYRRLRPGDSIQGTIDAELSGTDLVLVLWTSRSAQSDGVRAEIETARRLGLRVIPCLFEYDEAGAPAPPLPASLTDVLGVDFHHYGSGLAQVADLIVQLQGERLPEEARLDDEHPGRRLIEYLRGYLSYLANYRSLRDVPDERAFWVDRIITEIERFLDAGGDAETVRAMVEAARQSEVVDPEGIGQLVTRLEAALQSRGDDQPASEAAPPDADELTRRVAAVVPAEAIDGAVASIDAYLGAAVTALQALQTFALQAQSAAGVRVVSELAGYLHDPDDLIPDGQGRYGHLDDAWLILNTAFRLIESGLMPAHAVPIDWPSVIAADHLVRAVMPSEVLETLVGVVLGMLQVIQAEVAAYQPWFAAQGHGYAAVVPEPGSGGSWEDQMNEALLGTGLSVNF